MTSNWELIFAFEVIIINLSTGFVAGAEQSEPSQTRVPGGER